MSDFKTEWDIAMTTLGTTVWRPLDEVVAAIDEASENVGDYMPSEDSPDILTISELQKLTKAELIASLLEKDAELRTEIEGTLGTLRETLMTFADTFRDDLLDIPRKVESELKRLSVVRLLT